MRSVAAVLVALVLAGCGKQTETVALKRPAFRAFAVATGKSMLPTFGDGEVVVIEMCSYRDVGAGDTVIFWHETAKLFVHHRVVERDASGRWVTRGDNNAASDSGRMSADDFVGRTHKAFQ